MDRVGHGLWASKIAFSTIGEHVYRGGFYSIGPFIGVKVMRAIFVGLLSILLVGCATGGPSGSQVLTGSIAPSQSRLVMYRPSVLGFAIQPPYTVNGKVVANTQPGGFVVCTLAPGNYNVRVANVAGDTNLSFSGSEKADVQLVPGKTTYLKAEPQMGLVIGVVTISEVTERQGFADTAKMSKIAGNCP